MVMTETLYHADLGLPASFRTPTHVIRPRYTKHALMAATSDRYGKMELPATISLRLANVIEVGMTAGKVTKILFRMSYNDTLDMCFVVIPGPWIVKTVWFNEKSDLHRTLDATRYAAA